MKLSRGSVCRYCSFYLPDQHLHTYQYRLFYQVALREIFKLKLCVFIETVISQCVSKYIFYSSGSMEGLTAVVTGVEEKTYFY